VLAALLRATTDPAVEVRLAAVKALNEDEGGKNTQALLARLKDSEASVREEAASVLGHLKDPASVEGLLAASGSEANDKVREQMVEALEKLGKKANEIPARQSAPSRAGNGAPASTPK
jgi:HEAT repeat protein